MRMSGASARPEPEPLHLALKKRRALWMLDLSETPSLSGKVQQEVGTFPARIGWDRLDEGGIIVSGAVDFSGNGMPGHFRPLYRLQQGQKGIGACIRADPGRIATRRKDDGHSMVDRRGQRIWSASNY